MLLTPTLIGSGHCQQKANNTRLIRVLVLNYADVVLTPRHVIFFVQNAPQASSVGRGVS